MSVKATYKLYIDWNNDGDYADAGEDLGDVTMSAHITRGFNDALSRMATVGRATFVANNVSKAYSPPLHANVLPRCPVRFQMTYGGTTATLFEGYLEDIVPAPGVRGSRTVTFACVDAIALLDAYEGPIALLEGAYADDVINAVVNAVYAPASTDYDPGLNYFPFSSDRWEPPARYMNPGPTMRGSTPDEHASAKILQACISDWGFFYVSKAGVPTYRNRHTVNLNATAALTLDNSMSGMSYRKGASSVYNDVEVTCQPRAIGQTYEVLGRMSQQDALRIEAGGAVTVELQFRDPSNTSLRVGGKGVVTPVPTTDYAITDDEAGAGTDATASVTASALVYGDHAKVTLTNAAAFPVWVQRLQIRGLAVRVREPVAMRVTDITSIARYERRSLPVSAVLMSSPIDAQALATHLLSAYKDPQDQVDDVMFFANNSSTFMAAARDLELLDRVVLTEDQTGLTGYAGYIHRLNHTIEAGRIHRVDLGLATAYAVGGTPFTIGTSTIGGTDIFIY